MSLNRHTMLILMLAGSVGLPYLSSTEFGQQASKAMESGQPARDAESSSQNVSQRPTSSYESTSPAAAPATTASSSPSSSYSGPASNTSTSPPDTSAYSSSAASGAAATTTMAAAADTRLASADSGRHAPMSQWSTGGSSSPAKNSTERSSQSELPPHTLAEVLRFDITVPWIIAHWPRVSAGLSELDLHGYRVPLVTGTGESDLAGSLTYYFNKKQQLDRIIFHGTSGDPRPLITIVSANFELKRVIVSDPGLAFYQRKSWGKSHSELLIRPARVLRANDPNKRYEIEMAIKRP